MKSELSPTILVTGAGGGSGMYSIKIFKESTSAKIIAADAGPLSPGLYIADNFYIIPKASQPEKWKAKLIEIVTEQSVDIIIPNVDEELPLISKWADDFGAKVVISPLETIETCLDKWNLLETLKEVIPIPESSLINQTDNITYPCHIKPRTGRGSRNAHRLDSDTELQTILSKLHNNGLSSDEILVQEFLPGIEFTVDVLCDKSGNPKVIVPRERVRVDRGLSITGKVRKHPEIEYQVEQICSKLKFFGPINLQFKLNDNGEPRLLEINPRFSGGIPIPYAAGVNIPLLLLKLLAGIKPDNEEYLYREGYVLRYLTEIFIGEV